MANIQEYPDAPAIQEFPNETPEITPDAAARLASQAQATDVGRQADENTSALSNLRPSDPFNLALEAGALPFTVPSEALIAAGGGNLTDEQRRAFAKSHPTLEAIEASGELGAKIAPMIVPIGAAGQALLRGSRFARALSPAFGAGAAVALPAVSRQAGTVYANPKATAGEKLLAAGDIGLTSAIAGLGLTGGGIPINRLPRAAVEKPVTGTDVTVPREPAALLQEPEPIDVESKPVPPIELPPTVEEFPEEPPTKGVPNASTIPSTTSVSQPEIRPPVGEETPLRQQGPLAGAQGPQGGQEPLREESPRPPEKLSPGDLLSQSHGPVAAPVTPPIAPVLSPELAAPIGQDKKETEELTEVESVKKAREIAQGEGTPADKYRAMVDLYNAMPSLKTRTAESKTKQQYSTPPPLAYLANQLADIRGGDTILEPTAGHGMLVIDSDRNADLVLNELDKGRAGRLRQLWPGADVTEMDAIGDEHYNFAKKVEPDRVIANPPFGSRITASGQYERFPIRGATTSKVMTPSIDMAIAHSALDAMQQNGKAVLILGAKTGGVGASYGSDQSRAKAYNRPELLDLFNRYKVKDWFTVSGDLYEKMGAGWPVDVVVIEGKGKTPSATEGGLVRPWVQPPKVYSTWEELASKLPQGENAPTVEPGEPIRQPGGSSGGVLPSTGEGAGLRPGEPETNPQGFVSESPIGTPSPEPQRPQEPEPTGGTAQGDVSDSGGRETPAEDADELVEQPAAEGKPQTQPVVGGSPTVVPVVRGDIGKLNTPYTPVSKNGNPGLIAPGNLAPAMQQALLQLEQEVGMPVDDYVASKLGWSKPDLFKRLNAAQIDSAALMIRNIEGGTALITGDQMGVGKGRQVATAIAYARKHNLIPVFITAKKALYEDMAARDLPAIGMDDFNPFITDSAVDYRNAKGQKITNNSPKTEEMERIASAGQLPAGTHGVFTTYDQLKADKPKGWRETPKQKAARQRKEEAKPDGPRLAMLRALAPRALFILDESHTAAGATSDLFFALRKILPKAKGNFFASATFAKRPENLALYAGATSMRFAIDNPKTFLELMKRGGNALQQALSSMLTHEGEFVRREQDWGGVKFKFKKSSEDSESQIEAADQYTSYLRDLMGLSEMVNSAATKVADTENQVRPEEGQVDISSVGFGARLFNLSDQYLLALRADAVANEAIAELKNKRKPFIAVSSTMEGPLADLKARGLPLNFGGILLRQMQKMLEITIRDPMVEGGKRQETLTPEQLPDGGAMYRRLEEQIKNTDFGKFPISPIDYIKNKIKHAGYSIGEITGRNNDFDEQTGKVSSREKSQRNDILRGYNHGQIDALIVNKSGSTGLSAHTDPSFKDQRQRVMIVGQPALDINDFMQMIGRVMRFGQTSKPEYTVLQTALAAEVRFMTLLRKRMSSLNANTSADTESEMTGQEGFAEDIFNQVGDDVVARVMESNPDLARLADIDMASDDDEGNADFARKATGRFVLLSNADAAKLWNEIAEEYANTIRALDETGENPLKANIEDLQAKTLSSKVLVEGAKGQESSPFLGPAVLEKVRVKLPQKPLTHAKAIELAEQNRNRVEKEVREWLTKSLHMETERTQAAAQRGAGESELDHIRRGFQAARDAVNTALARLGETYGVDPSRHGESKFHGVVTDLKLRGAAMSDFSSPSKQHMTLAVNTGRRIMRFPLSMTEGNPPVLVDVDGDPQEIFDSNSEASGDRQMITGNILKGYAEAVKMGGESRPRITIYTKEDGSVGIGVMLPQSSGELKSTKPIETPEQLSAAIGNAVITADKLTINTDGIISMPANGDYKPVWGHPDFSNVIQGQARQAGPNIIGRMAENGAPYLFRILKQAGIEIRERLPEPPSEQGGEPPSVGPGAATNRGATATQAGQVGGGLYTNIAPLEQLADAVKNFPKQKGTFGEKLNQWMDSIGVPIKDFATRALIRAKAAPMAIKDALTTLNPVTELERRVGVWNADEWEGGVAARAFANSIKKVFPDRSKLRALSNWIDADGDASLLQERAAATKNPSLRKTYEDAANFGQHEIELANAVKDYFEFMLAWGQREGVLDEGLENYLHRYYRESDPMLQKRLEALRYLRFTKDFNGFRKRFYATDFDAEQAGLMPEKDAAKRILAYDHGFRAALTARAFVKSSYDSTATITDEYGARPELDVAGGGMVVGENQGKNMTLINPKHRFNGTEPKDYRGDYVKFDHPAFRKYKFAMLDANGNPILVQGDILVHPKVASKYAALFERSWWNKGPVRRALLAISSFVKQTMLIGPFHLVQITTGGIEHRISPFHLIELTPNDPAQRRMAEAGLFPSGNGAAYYTDGLQGGGLLDKIPIAGEYFQAAKDWLFNDYIPRWKMTLALAVERRMMEKYASDLNAGRITPEQVTREAARQSAAVFGGQNQRAIFRSRSFQDTLRFLFLAPDFGEERLRQVVQAAGKYGAEQRLALLFGALALTVIAKTIEYQLTGQMRFDRPFGVTYNGKIYSLRNPAADLYRFITSPLRYVAARLNPVTMRPLLEGLTGRDYFGKKRDGMQQVEDEAGQIIPIPVRGAFNDSQTVWDSMLNATGITVTPDPDVAKPKSSPQKTTQTFRPLRLTK